MSGPQHPPDGREATLIKLLHFLMAIDGTATQAGNPAHANDNSQQRTKNK
jgi:hypothetical protein